MYDRLKPWAIKRYHGHHVLPASILEEFDATHWAMTVFNQLTILLSQALSLIVTINTMTRYCIYIEHIRA